MDQVEYRQPCNNMEWLTKPFLLYNIIYILYIIYVNNGTSIINAIDKEYDFRDDLDQLSEDDDLQYKQTRIETRSRAKKRKEKQRQLRDDDDSIEDEEYFSKLNVKFNDVRNYMLSHEDFMYQIFGHRSDDDILDFDKYRNYQESDNIISLVIKLFKMEDKSKWSESDLDLIREWNFGLYEKLIDQQLVIENHILKCKEWNEILNKFELKIVVPFFLIGKLMDYAHHNLTQHHFSAEYTIETLKHRFWWSTLEKDVRWFCKNCISCQYVKGSKRHRAPMVQRNQPEPLEHLFADCLGPIYGRYYILVLVDYATGFTMLIPMEGADALSIAQAILQHWFRIFGYFRLFESDWGPGFNNLFMEYLTDILDCPHEIAEPRNHRSIGKVERVIGFVQSIINHYNLLLDNELTDQPDGIDKAWIRIQILIPVLQLALNQRKMRITGVSPNMAIFGMNMNDAIDIGRMKHLVQEMKENKQLKRTEYEHAAALSETIEKISKVSKTSWEEVTYLSKEWYDSKYNITKESVKRMKQKFKVGTEVLYYIGDKQIAQGKWAQKWTGPWLVARHIGDSSVIVADPKTGNGKRVSYDRLKQFNTIDFIEYSKVIQFDEDYIEFQDQLKKRLQKYNVKYRNQELELDYTLRNPKKKKRKRKKKKQRKKVRKRKRKVRKRS